jgi:hypothetical protein
MEQMMEHVLAKMDANQAEMKTDEEKMAGRLEVKIEANQTKIYPNNEKFDVLQGNVVSKMVIHQEKMEAAIHSIRSELEKTNIRWKMSCHALTTRRRASTRNCLRRLTKQVDLQAVKMSLDTRTKSLQETLATTKSNFRTELNLLHIEAQATRAEALTHHRKMEAKIEATQCKFES